jgi:hypothetical protein
VKGRKKKKKERRGHPTFGRKKGPEKEGAAQLFVKEGGKKGPGETRGHPTFCERRGL